METNQKERELKEMKKENRWDYLVDLDKTLRDEIETMMHGFSFEFEEIGPSGKPMNYCLTELEEINKRFDALDGLETAICSLRNMRSLPVDWNSWGYPKKEDELPF